MSLPSAFIKQLTDLLGKEAQHLFDSLELAPSLSIRYHPAKSTKANESLIDPVPWCPSAQYLVDRPSFTLDPAFHGGRYYVLEASSMSVLYALKQWLTETVRPLKILDLCAAPGGKSTLLRELGPQHLIVSNEVIRSRYNILKENIEKWGYKNVIITNHDVNDFKALKNYFDIVLVDAPCSGEGLFRKDHKARTEWSLNNVQLCTARQKRILAEAQELVADEGIMVYCTCTYNEKENTENAAWLVDEMDMESLQVHFPEDFGVTERMENNVFVYQFYPHKTKGEGFFLAGFRKHSSSSSLAKTPKRSPFQVISKSDEALLDTKITSETELVFLREGSEAHSSIKMMNNRWFPACQFIKAALPKSATGTAVGEIKQGILIPNHGLAMSSEVKLDYPIIVLDKPQALKFLKGITFEHQSSEIGWHLIIFEDIYLGWAKVLPKRINNYYPKGYRIRMDLPKN